MTRSTQRLLASHDRMQRRLDQAKTFAELRALVEEMVEHAGFEIVVLRPACEGRGELTQRLLDALGSHEVLADLMDSCAAREDFDGCLAKARSYFQLHRAAFDRLLLPGLEEQLSGDEDSALDRRIENWAPIRPDTAEHPRS